MLNRSTTFNQQQTISTCLHKFSSEAIYSSDTFLCGTEMVFLNYWPFLGGTSDVESDWNLKFYRNASGFASVFDFLIYFLSVKCALYSWQHTESRLFLCSTGRTPKAARCSIKEKYDYRPFFCARSIYPQRFIKKFN